MRFVSWSHLHKATTIECTIWTCEVWCRGCLVVKGMATSNNFEVGCWWLFGIEVVVVSVGVAAWHSSAGDRVVTSAPNLVLPDDGCWLIDWFQQGDRGIGIGLLSLEIVSRGLCAHLNVEKLTKSTSCELICEQWQSLLLSDINSSQYRKELSFQTIRFVRSTSSLAAMHQWSKFPILTQDFTILAWFYSSAKVSARSSRQYLLRKEVEIIGNGSEEPPSRQSIAITQ